MLLLDTVETASTPAPIDVMMDTFAESALEMTPRQAVVRLCEPKDHLPREMAAYIDELMRWVIELDRDRVVPAE
jgi:hypothetical protein